MIVEQCGINSSDASVHTSYKDEVKHKQDILATCMGSSGLKIAIYKVTCSTADTCKNCAKCGKGFEICTKEAYDTKIKLESGAF